MNGILKASGWALSVFSLLGFLTANAEEKPWPQQRLRGINTTIEAKTSSGTLDENFFQKMREWNVNLVRVDLSVDRRSPWDVKKGQPLPPIPEENPLKPYEKNLEGLDRIMELAGKYQIYIIPSLFDVVGRKNDVMFQSKDDAGFYANIAPVWEYIAIRHGKNPWLLGYDLLNEPNGANTSVWTDKIAPEVISRIRKIDPNTWIIYEPAPWALPDQGFESLKPLDDPKLIYSFHFYYPHTYTHQGIHGYKTPEYMGKPYPGTLKLFPDTPAAEWDKQALEASMSNAIAFQKKYGVKIFIGEFSAIRWAPGGDKWLADTIDIFEKHGWDWTYHSYYEWNGWNPTFGPDDPSGNTLDGGKMTPNLKVLLDYWKQNQKG